MSDAIDLAQERDQQIRDDALAERMRMMQTAPPAIEGGVRLCVGCGVEIPARRLKANPNAARCVDCQDDHEKLERRRT